LAPVPSPIGPAVNLKKKTAALDVENDKSAWVGEYGTWSLEKHAEQVGKRLRPMAATLGSPQAVDTPLVVGGLSERSVREMTSLLSPLGLVPLQAGGAGTTTQKDAPMHYVDGGAVAVQLMRGDSAAQATGTITHVIGNKALGFGHPMME